MVFHYFDLNSLTLRVLAMLMVIAYLCTFVSKIYQSLNFWIDKI